MTTDAMNCERFNDQLMEYLEHDVDAATRASVERHAVACEACGTLLADLRKLRVDATNLPELAPSRDLWNGIAIRIETPVVPIGAGVGHIATDQRIAPRAPRGGARRWLNAGLIAASLVAAAMLGYGARTPVRQVVVAPPAPTLTADSSSVRLDSAAATTLGEGPGVVSAPPGTRVASRSGATTPPTAPVTAPTAPSGGEVQLAVARLTADYDREIGRLRVLIDQRRSQLDPTTVAVIERNLAVIDTAIAESRRAIVNDPSSRFLIDFLNQSLRDKVELMRTAALLPSRT